MASHGYLHPTELSTCGLYPQAEFLLLMCLVVVSYLTRPLHKSACKMESLRSQMQTLPQQVSAISLTELDLAVIHSSPMCIKK